MKKQIKFKYIWIALNFVLLAIPVFVPSNNVDVIGICLSIPIILSYPLGILAGVVFFYFHLLDNSIGSLYLMLFVFSVLAYIQWFVIFPRFARFVKNKLFGRDLIINVSANLETIKKALPESETRFETSDFQQNWYDERRRTPVERVFEDKDE
jgi:hypothetical protein